MKVYYAHFMGIYNTPQERRDVETLEALGFEVINPNCEEISAQYNYVKEQVQNQHTQIGFETAFEVFLNYVRECEVFAFRALPDSRISGGVALELKEAKKLNKIIIELPCSTISRSMNGEETREYLHDMGNR